jgi:hypothetical protein|tara:strand:- start:4262 stop:4402 length:141 start_codon:yes stop_codon:yes gene_type:complete
MAKVQTTTNRIQKPKVSRPGVHAKSKNSVNKHGKNYKKKYRGQGKG